MFLGPAPKNVEFLDIGRLIMEDEAVGKKIGQPKSQAAPSASIYEMTS
jgi:hypothetical protein